jgi:mycoredoxin
MTANRREIYGTRGCPHTTELREQLEWRNEQFVEYDVETDAAALQRLRALTPGPLAVPVLVEDGLVIAVGWQGRSCPVAGLRANGVDKS